MFLHPFERIIKINAKKKYKKNKTKKNKKKKLYNFFDLNSIDVNRGNIL